MYKILFKEAIEEVRNIRDVEEVKDIFKREGIQVQDVGSIFDNPTLTVGGILAGCEGKIYLIGELYDNLSKVNETIHTTEYLTETELREMEPMSLISHFSKGDVFSSTDKVVLEKAYAKQWKDTYNVLYSISEEINIEHRSVEDVMGKLDINLPLIKDIRHVKYYMKLLAGINHYEQQYENMEQRTIVKMISEDEDQIDIRCIYLDIDTQTGELLLKHNYEGFSIEKIRGVKEFLVPIHNLEILIKILDDNTKEHGHRENEFTFNPIDIIQNRKMGSISGFPSDSYIDKKVRDILDIDYNLTEDRYMGGYVKRYDEYDKDINIDNIRKDISKNIFAWD